MKQSISLFLVTCLITTVSASVHAEKFYFFTYSQETASIAMPLLAKAYEGIGHSLTVEELPPKRSLDAANKGMGDGEFVRVGGLSKRYENLIQIPVPIIEVATVVVTRKRSTFKPQKWTDLSTVKFGVLRGMQLARLRTHGTDKLIVDDVTGLLEMVSRGRLDAAVLHLNTARKYDGQVSGLQVLYPPLEMTPLYHYVHRRHRKLVPELTDQLRQVVAFRR